MFALGVMETVELNTEDFRFTFALSMHLFKPET